MNKIALITGATSGIGEGCARRFARGGYNLILTGRNTGKLEILKKELEAEGVEVLALAFDVRNREAAKKAVDYIPEEWRNVDVLINNAGVMDDMSPIGDATNEKYEKVMAVNMFGPFCAMRKAVNVFLEQGNGGSIVNVASLGGMRTCAGAIYCASKAAVISMTKNTAYMYMKDGIRANAIAPGGIASEIATSMGQPNPNGYGRIQPVLACGPEPGSTEEIAKAALFLASEDSAYISGDVLVVDGGWNAG